MPGLVYFVSKLWKGDKPVGEGRGAAILAKNTGDPNKTLKMAQKSAFIDAVIRASGLSDFYTQDSEDMNPRDVQVQKTDITPSKKQIGLIADLARQKGYTKEDVIAAGFKSLTGGKDGTASKLIDWLTKAPSKVVQDDTPLDAESQEIADSIDF